ncbi:MAG: hypothetical protein ACE5FJ_06620 [Gemmatimonadales bacterium]
MTLRLFHRTTIGEARTIVRRGFIDKQWDLGTIETKSEDPVSVTGVWFSGRPLGHDEGVEGDAQLEVSLELSDEDMEPFELHGILHDARFWVAPADLINGRAHVRIAAVDPTTSWFGEAVPDDE